MEKSCVTGTVLWNKHGLEALCFIPSWNYSVLEELGIGGIMHWRNRLLEKMCVTGTVVWRKCVQKEPCIGGTMGHRR